MFCFRQRGCYRFDETKIWRPQNVIRLINICIRIETFIVVYCRFYVSLSAHYKILRYGKKMPRLWGNNLWAGR